MATSVAEEQQVATIAALHRDHRHQRLAPVIARLQALARSHLGPRLDPERLILVVAEAHTWLVDGDAAIRGSRRAADVAAAAQSGRRFLAHLHRLNLWALASDGPIVAAGATAAPTHMLNLLGLGQALLDVEELVATLERQSGRPSPRGRPTTPEPIDLLIANLALLWRRSGRISDLGFKHGGFGDVVVQVLACLRDALPAAIQSRVPVKVDAVRHRLVALGLPQELDGAAPSP